MRRAHAGIKSRRDRGVPHRERSHHRQSQSLVKDGGRTHVTKHSEIRPDEAPATRALKGKMTAPVVPGFRTQASFDDKDLSGQVLDGLKLVDRRIKGARFDGTSLRKAELDRSTFIDCSFVDAVLDGASFYRTVLENCDFSGASLVKVDAREAIFRTAQVMSYRGDAVAAKANMAMTFDGATIEDSSFQGARLNNASMVNVRATNVDFREANLEGARFENCSLAGSDFAGARIQGADFSQSADAREVLSEWAQSVVTMQQKMDEDDLVEAIRRHEQWLESDGKAGERLVLRAVDLSHMRLDGRDLSGSDLRMSRLDFVSLKNARLIAADLRGCSFSSADLSNADLRAAQIESDALIRAVATGVRT